MYVFIDNLREDIYWLMYIESFNVPFMHAYMHAVTSVMFDSLPP